MVATDELRVVEADKEEAVLSGTVVVESSGDTSRKTELPFDPSAILILSNLTNFICGSLGWPCFWWAWFQKAVHRSGGSSGPKMKGFHHINLVPASHAEPHHGKEQPFVQVCFLLILVQFTCCCDTAIVCYSKFTFFQP